ncbi:MAG: winged helix-turn-helix transcriptional regulator [Alphaproteobacteria bacterium]|nr:winged helix-turn-helix transcriptional regulator [Alphaproteobacteria bacterium]
MRNNAEEACSLLKALAHPHRLMIVCQLAEKERSVGELAEFLELRDSTVSQHLSLMRRDGIVHARRDGQTLWYSIKNDKAQMIIDLLYKIYCPA